MSIEHNNTLISDPNKITNIFNDYFENIGTDLAENICEYGSNVYTIFSDAISM